MKGSMERFTVRQLKGVFECVVLLGVGLKKRSQATRIQQPSLASLLLLNLQAAQNCQFPSTFRNNYSGLYMKGYLSKRQYVERTNAREKRCQQAHQGRYPGRALGPQNNAILEVAYHPLGWRSFERNKIQAFVSGRPQGSTPSLSISAALLSFAATLRRCWPPHHLALPTSCRQGPWYQGGCAYRVL